MNTNILYRYDKASTINRMESLPLRHILYARSLFWRILLKSWSYSRTNRLPSRRDDRPCVANMLACDRNSGNLKVFRRKTRPFLIFSMQAHAPPRARLIHSISRISRLIYVKFYSPHYYTSPSFLTRRLANFSSSRIFH